MTIINQIPAPCYKTVLCRSGAVSYINILPNVYGIVVASILHMGQFTMARDRLTSSGVCALPEIVPCRTCVWCAIAAVVRPVSL